MPAGLIEQAAQQVADAALALRGTAHRCAALRLSLRAPSSAPRIDFASNMSVPLSAFQRVWPRRSRLDKHEWGLMHYPPPLDVSGGLRRRARVGAGQGQGGAALDRFQHHVRADALKGSCRRRSFDEPIEITEIGNSTLSR